jgi:hypothetical protein
LLETAHQKLWSIYGPVIVSEYAKTAFGSHPCRVVSVSYEQNAVTAEAAGSSPVVPAIPFLSTCVNFGETIEDPKGHGFVPFLVSIFARQILSVVLTLQRHPIQMAVTLRSLRTKTPTTRPLPELHVSQA